MNAIVAEDVFVIEKHDNNGNVKMQYKFSLSRAAASIITKFNLAMIESDEKTIWIFDGSVYHNNGRIVIKDALYDVANQITPVTVNSVLDRITTKLLLTPVKFDPDPYLLGVKNGLIDLRTGEMREYRAEDYITDQIEVTYDPAATCPRFITFLEEVAPNPIDRLMLIDWFSIHAIRLMFPYVMFLNGLGRNGKGVYERVLRRFFGEHSFSSMPLEELNTKISRFSGAYLAGKRGQIVAEAGESHKQGKRTIPTAFLKNATGDGTIDSDQKGIQQRLKFKPFYKATIDANDMPRIEDSSRGWIERFCKADLPFNFVDDPKPDTLECKKDPYLFEKLTTDAELSGILNLILFRTPDLIKTKTIIKRTGEEMFAEYERQSNSVTAFLEAFCDYELKVFRSKDEVSKDEVSEDVPLNVIFKAYQHWCDQNVADKVDDKRFGAAVKNFCNGAKAERMRDGNTRVRIYHGLTFDAKAYQSQVSQRYPIIVPLKTVSVPSVPSNEEEIWKNIKDTFGENGKPPSFSNTGTDSESENRIGTAIDVNGTESSSIGLDVDLPTGRIPHEDIEPCEVLICYRARLRDAAIIEYGINGWVDPDKVALSVGILECQAMRGLEELGYQNRPEGGYTQRKLTQSVSVYGIEIPC